MNYQVHETAIVDEGSQIGEGSRAAIQTVAEMRNAPITENPDNPHRCWRRCWDN